MKWPVLILGLCAAGATAPALASQVGVGAQSLSGGYDNAKFAEYANQGNRELRLVGDLDLGGVLPESSIYGDLKGSGWLDGDWIGGDGELALEAGAYGLLKVGASLSQMGHVFAYGAKTLYSGAGGSYLSLNDSVQSTVGSGSSAQQAAKLKNAVDAGQNKIDIFIVRDRSKASVQYTPFPGGTAAVAASQEHRSGTKVLGAGFGLSNGIEVPEPVNYYTTGFQGELGWAGELPLLETPLDTSASYELSNFYNTNTSFYFENPFRTTDGFASNGYSATTATGAAVGRQSTPPSNQYQRVALEAALKLPWTLRLVGRGGYSETKQDEEILPAANNKALYANATQAALAVLPAKTASGQVYASDFDVILSAEPLHGVELKGFSRYRHHENATPQRAWPAVWVDGTTVSLQTPVYVSVEKHVNGAEAAYEFLHQTDVSVEYEKVLETFKGGSANGVSEDVYKAALNTRYVDWLELRTEYEFEQRLTEYPNYTAANFELPWMRKYYAADLDRNASTTMLAVYPLDGLRASVEYQYIYDNYRNTMFGRLQDRKQMSSASLSYSFADWLQVTPTYLHEFYDSKQRSRQWSPAGGTGDPYSAANAGKNPLDDPSNWTATTTETVQTVALNADLSFLEDKLGLSLDGSWSQSEGRLEFASAVGVAVLNPDNNMWEPTPFPAVDSARWLTLKADARYQIVESVGAKLGWAWSKWEIDDYNYDGYTQVLTAANGNYGGLYSMDTLYRSFDTQIFTAGVDYSF